MGNDVKVWYPLVLDDAGRNRSKRIGQYHDCTVRTLAIVTNSDYDDVYDLLAENGRKSCQGFDLSGFLKKKKGQILGGRFIKLSTHKDATPKTIHITLNKGRYVLETKVHAWALIDGVHHDLWRVKQNEPILAIWEWTEA